MEQLKRLAMISGYALGTALLLGAIGLIIGFFGPILIGVLVGSKANQARSGASLFWDQLACF